MNHTLRGSDKIRQINVLSGIQASVPILCDFLRERKNGPNVFFPLSIGWDAADEKAPFLRNEPVKLTPAWEGNNLPNDTLNLKGKLMIKSQNQKTK